VTHILRVNCAEIANDRPVQPALEAFGVDALYKFTFYLLTYEIFDIKCRFKWSKS